MAAYAALVSLMHIIHDIQHHPSPPVSFDTQHLQSLTQTLTDYLEASKPDGDEADPLEMRIADAAEDVIESHIVDTIHRANSVVAKISRFFNRFPAFKKPKDEQTRSLKFYQDLQSVMEEMDLIKQMAAEKDVAVHAHNVSAASAAPLTSSSLSSSAMVCSDAVLEGLLAKLMEDRLDRQVIPVVGMGGIGKTTLARTIYALQAIKERFVVCAWVTVSQTYNTRELLCQVLLQIQVKTDRKGNDISEDERRKDISEMSEDERRKYTSEMSEDEVGCVLRKYLFGRSFLIVLDDMCSIDAWEKMQHYFPNNPLNSQGSRILETTRLTQLASQLNNNYLFQMEFLDEAHSRDLFFQTVFGEKSSCPHELEEIGNKIVKNCRGLPLSIVVVGGLLKKTEHTYKSWESMSHKLASTVNLENGEHCLRLLKLSYNHLPLYLKPCFLYMGVFEEDDKIKVSTIIKLWVSEGFLKPINGTSLKTIAKGFLKDLADRNLIMIDDFVSTLNQKGCKIHDLFRDLCMKEGEKYGFYHVIGQSQGINRQCRRIVVPRNVSKKKVLEALQSMPHVRSVICENGKVPHEYRNSKLLRTFHAYKFRTIDDKSYLNPLVVQHVNLRHLAVEVRRMSTFFSSLHLFRNLYTIIVSCPSYSKSTAPVEIWQMRQCRHIEFPEGRVTLPDPPSDVSVIMENLEILKGALSFKCSEEVVKRIPNLRKLETQYFIPPKRSWYDDCYCVGNIQYLSKLESLNISCDRQSGAAPYLRKLSFPASLKSLTLCMNPEFEWQVMLEKIGSLPHLEKLRLWIGFFRSGEWDIEEGQFPKLKYCCYTDNAKREKKIEYVWRM